MFRKIRIRLTLLSGGITTLILLVMTLGYLYISEKNLMENKLLSYENDINTIASNLEQQSILTHSWLSKLYNSMKQTQSREELLREAWFFYHEKEETLSVNKLSYLTHYSDFYFQGQDNKEYLGFVITLSKNDSCLEMLILAPLESLNNQITHQRLNRPNSQIDIYNTRPYR